MLLRLPDLLGLNEITQLLMQVTDLHWEEGLATAQAATRRKHNEQLTQQHPLAGPLLSQLATRIARHPAVVRWAEPRQIARLMFSRYRVGMYYHSHNDAGLTGAQARADISFTLFLSPPSDCEGGDLVLETALGEVVLKESPGTLVMYDTGFSHRVTPVLSGERIVVVGWIESLVRSPQGREILRDLGASIRAASVRDPEGEEAIRLRRIRANLLRMWAET
jgi:PKHD-type hydroxylase